MASFLNSKRDEGTVNNPSMLSSSPSGVMIDMMDSDIVVSDIEL